MNKVLQRLEKYLNLEGFLEKSLKIKFTLKSTEKSLKCLEKSLNYTIFSVVLNTVYSNLNQYKIVVPLYRNNFSVLMSPLTQSSISEVKF